MGSHYKWLNYTPACLGIALFTGLFKAQPLWPELLHHFSHIILELFKILLPEVQNQSIGLVLILDFPNQYYDLREFPSPLCAYFLISEMSRLN